MGKPKPPRGRPPLGADGRTRVVTIKLSEIEYAAIAAAATKTAGTVSSWLRDHALAAIKES